MLTRLEAKGAVSRRQSERGYVFAPTVAEDKAGHSALGHIVRTFFNGSAASAASALLGMDERLKPAELDELEAMIAACPGAPGEAVMHVLVELALKSLLVAALSLLLLRFTRHRSAAERSLIAHLGLLALVLLPAGQSGAAATVARRSDSRSPSRYCGPDFAVHADTSGRDPNRRLDTHTGPNPWCTPRPSFGTLWYRARLQAPAPARPNPQAPTGPHMPTPSR